MMSTPSQNVPHCEVKHYLDVGWPSVLSVTLHQLWPKILNVRLQKQKLINSELHSILSNMKSYTTLPGVSCCLYGADLLATPVIR